ncbi:hypothetical protein CEY09_23970 [Achromobacter marplatensis]|uniref:hypothetical protein n=1 Tax=Achromobacter marplatensis TaxID=470868 RepID=UPI000B519E15|nr:hypothetical protein [Achromobacter marplatensis]OWT61635.1 hypothetical protein CEY09_23970 [Achromobacter marplatensis]
MTDAQLAFYSSWSSIISFFVALISLAYVRSIKTNIVKFRRKQRLRQLVDEVMRIPDDAIPLSSASTTKLAALKRNIPTRIWYCCTSRGKATLEVHRHIDGGDIVALKEAIHDWSSYSEEA